MYNTAVVGTSFGDEGKGKIVDFLSKDFNVVVRYSGGPNAGHTLIYKGNKIVFKHIPCGILYPHVTCILGHGMVIDPNIFHEEVKTLESLGINLDNHRLKISDRAHLILPEYIQKDKDQNDHIGTTKKGIGPTYESKINRSGKKVYQISESLGFSKECVESIKRFSTKNTPYMINSNIDNGHCVMFEGAQGTLLDIDLGTYPYVTSSNSTVGGICTGTGVGIKKIEKVIGITKAYTTRVGEGPFPSEVSGDLANTLQTVGNEFGSVTGRPRKVGWLDMPLLRYAIMVNSIDSLAVTKLDVLSSLNKIKIVDTYPGGFLYPDLNNLPTSLNESCYSVLPGWKCDISNIKNFSLLPKEAQYFIRYIENNLSPVKIDLVSVGPDRDQTITV